jgi:hypothetical protein
MGKMLMVVLTNKVGDPIYVVYQSVKPRVTIDEDQAKLGQVNVVPAKLASCGEVESTTTSQGKRREAPKDYCGIGITHHLQHRIDT